MPEWFGRLFPNILRLNFLSAALARCMQAGLVAPEGDFFFRLFFQFCFPTLGPSFGHVNGPKLVLTHLQRMVSKQPSSMHDTGKKSLMSISELYLHFWLFYSNVIACP